MQARQGQGDGLAHERGQIVARHVAEEAHAGGQAQARHLVTQAIRLAAPPRAPRQRQGDVAAWQAGEGVDEHADVLARLERSDVEDIGVRQAVGGAQPRGLARGRDGGELSVHGRVGDVNAVQGHAVELVDVLAGGLRVGEEAGGAAGSPAGAQVEVDELADRVGFGIVAEADIVDCDDAGRGVCGGQDVGRDEQRAGRLSP